MHDVYASDQFGNRVLDLQARIHLQKIKVTVAVCQDLDGAGVRVSRSLGGFHRDLAHSLAHVGIDRWRGAFFNNFLMPPLNRAIALAKIDRISVFVREHLHFNVSRINDRLLDIDFIVTKGALGLAAGCIQRRS